MPPKPAVDKSPYRAEIIKKLLAGESGRSVEKWLIDTHGEKAKISHVSITNYKNNNLDITGKAKKKIEERKKKEVTRKKIAKAVDKEVEIDDEIEEAVDNIVTGIDFLNEVIKDANNVKLNHNVSIDPDKETPLKREAHKLNIINTGIRASDVIAKILKDEPEPPDVNIFNLNGFDEDEQRDIKKLAQSLARSDSSE